MESGVRTTLGSHRSEDHDVPYENQRALPTVCDARTSLPEGKTSAPPSQSWRLIIPYLHISETMSLRCTAHVVQHHLRAVTDGILDGCRAIDILTAEVGVTSTPPPLVIEKLMTRQLDGRCYMMKRYARQVGLANASQPGSVAAYKRETVEGLKGRYFQKRPSSSGSRQEKAVLAWRRAVIETKAEILRTTFRASDSIALSALYAAEMYAPLLAVIPLPLEHNRRVMAEAEATLSTLRWMDFLYAIDALKDFCNPVARAYRTMAANMDRFSPMPRIEVFVAILHASMIIPGPLSLRERCIERIGISATRLNDEITPCMTQRIVDAILTDPLVRGIDVPYRLRRLASCWDAADLSFASSLHQSFLTALARRAIGGAIPWSSLCEADRGALRTRVLGFAPEERERYGLSGPAIVAFWGVCFEITDRNTSTLLPNVLSRIEALPWPLQAVLWRLAADAHADPMRAWRGNGVPAFHDLTVERIDALCIQALQEGRPQCALPVLQATLRWQVTQVCMDDWQQGAAHESIPCVGEAPPSRPCPSFSPLAWSVFQGCSIAQRLPFIAALFSYRDVLTLCGRTWEYGKVVSQDIVSFLCNPHSRLKWPSGEVVHVLTNHLPLCGHRLPEFALGPREWEAAFFRRFDVTEATFSARARYPGLNVEHR